MTDLFAADNQPAVDTEPTGQTQTVDLAKLQNDVAIMQRRLEDKDNFIETLKSERRADQDRIKLLETSLQKLAAEQDILAQVRRPAEDPVVPMAAPTITPEQLRQQGFLTQADLIQLEQAKIAQANLNTVTEALKAKYGADAKEYLEKQCAKLGITPDFAKAQAAQSPAAFMKLFDLTPEAPKPTQSTHGTDFITNPAPAEPQLKSVMFGMNSKEVTEQWKLHREKVLKQMES